MKSIEKEGVLVPLLVRTKVLLAAAKMAEKIVDVVYEKKERKRGELWVEVFRNRRKHLGYAIIS